LRGVVSAADLDGEWPTADCTPPIWDALRQRRYLYRRAVHYGKHPAQVLDVWRRKDLPAQPAPVLVFLPGGAWVHGRCVGQGSALMSRLAQQGWVCLAVDYRAAPHYRWPRHIVDVKTAIAWARAAPPFLVIHGRRDSVIPVDQARSFGERLRGVSHAKVGYLELPGAGHAFDLIDGERAGEMAHATALFLNQVYRSKTQIGAKEVI
jgi:acetyl esterase/lipase